MEYIKDILKDDELQKDEILEFLNEISHKDYGLDSPITVRSYKNFLAGIKNTSILPDDINMERWGPLFEETNSMHRELEKLVGDFMFFYGQGYKVDLSPQQVNRVIKYFIIRIKRLGCVMDPEYSLFKSFDKKSKFHYHMVRGYWIDEMGKKVRSVSRNVGNVEATIEDILIKTLKLNIPNIEIFETGNNDKEPDLIIINGKNKWAVELEYNSKEHYIRMFFGFELWRLYKDTYKLIV